MFVWYSFQNLCGSVSVSAWTWNSSFHCFGGEQTLSARKQTHLLSVRLTYHSKNQSDDLQFDLIRAASKLQCSVFARFVFKYRERLIWLETCFGRIFFLCAAPYLCRWLDSYPFATRLISVWLLFPWSACLRAKFADILRLLLLAIHIKRNYNRVK